MAQTTRTSPRARARFSRTTAPSPRGRVLRPGTGQMRPRRTPARTPVQTMRPAGRITRRKAKQPTGIAGALARLLPTGAAAKATPGSKTGKAGGIAAMAAAAGVAYRNRDKLTAMLNRKRASTESNPAPVTPAPGPRLETPPSV